jgi:arylformamidase
MRYDISIAYGAETPPWPGDTPYSCRWAWDMAQGASVNVGHVTTSLHLGTHADAPLHVIPNGAPSDSLPLHVFSGRARVLDVQRATEGSHISVDQLSALLSDGGVPARLLLRTGVSVATGVFPDRWPTLTEGAAAWLAAQGLRLLGVDAPSVDERDARELLVHHALFGAGAYVIENLRLGDVPDGEYHLSAYPLLVTGADAAPLRAVLESVPE